MINRSCLTSPKNGTKAQKQVLFYDDTEAVNGMPPMLGNLIKDFPEWGEHTNGIAQYIGK